MSKPTVYLAGPVMSVTDGGAGWRDRVSEEFGDDYEFRNPLAKYNVPADDLEIVAGHSNPRDPSTVGVREIVEEDKRLLRESDAILVGYSACRSVGTPMEVMWGHGRDYPIVLWIRDGTRIDHISPWYRYHVGALTNSVEMALDRLARTVGDGDDD